MRGTTLASYLGRLLARRWPEAVVFRGNFSVPDSRELLRDGEQGGDFGRLELLVGGQLGEVPLVERAADCVEQSIACLLVVVHRDLLFE